MARRRLVGILLSLSLPMLGMLALASAPAQAHQPSTPAPSAGALPSAVPSSITPQINDGAVWSVAQVGNTLVIGGSFTKIGGVSHPYLAAINATTGALSTTFNAVPNDQVYSVMPGPDGHSVYVGGAFTQVNGQPQQMLTLVDTNTGQPVPGFHAPTFDYGMIRDMAVSGGRLYVAGFFSKVGGANHAGIAALNGTTGAVDPYLSVQFAGHHNDTGSGAQGYIGPWAIDVSPDGTRLVATGNFKTADGLVRDQLAMIDLDAGSAVVDPNWATTRYSPYCFSWAFDGYTRGVTFAPDSSWFVVDATGGGNPGTLCDATSRFETASTGTNIQPTWVDETGGDTVWGTTVTPDVVYIGGHNRWNNNPQGVDQAKPGAVPRPGLAALDPVSGRPLAWNPGHNPLGNAVYAMLATPAGLWMGYNFNYIGNYQYKRMKIAFFPYQGGYTMASTTTGQLPGSVYLGNLASNGQTNVLYRVDAGGPAIESTDGGPNWSEDDAASRSQYNNQQSNMADYSPVAHLNANVPSTTPAAIFDHELWSPTDSPPQNWDFPVPAGTHTEVRLYFANRYTGTSQVGQRVFNVSLEGTTVLDHYDIVADTGDQTGTMKSFDVTSDGDINISLTHVTENPLIDGIEIINKDVPAPPPPTDTLSAVGFDGSTATGPSTVPNTGIPWSQTHGAFVVGDQLFYGASDGFLHRATISGSTFGTPTKVDPYHDPVWDGVDTNDGTTFDGASPQLYGQMSSVTGMFYNAGRLYFTLKNDANLHWAWFSPDSGIVDNTEFTATSSVDFSNADGMFVSGNTLYFVKKSDGSMYSVGFANGVVTGSPTLVNGPGTGGVDWTNRSLFFAPAPPANHKPTAAFTSSCTGGGCAFDGSSSTDSDGSIVDYSWDFGDGSPAGSGVTPSHAYGALGDYDVTLTVTDNSGGTDTVTHQVSITSLSKQIAFVGADHSGSGTQTKKSVTIPSTASVGDTMELMFTHAKSSTWSGPGAGWTQVGSTLTNVTIRSSVWVKQVAPGDPGSDITFTTAKAGKAVASLGVYSGVSTSDPVDAIAVVGDPGGTSHTTPTVTPTAGDWVVSLWTDKSPGVSAWTPPAGVTKRDDGYGTGSAGRYSVLLADSGGPVTGDPYGALTATTNSDSDKAIMWTIALRPGASGSNQDPHAAFTSSCDTSGVCSFDGSGSMDPDGSIASYSWTFDDGGTSTQESPSHTYAASNTYNVMLTVTDNQGATDSVTHQVTVTVNTPPNGVAFVAAAHSAPGSQTSKSVTIPAAAHVGDTMVLVFTNGSGATWSGPGAGWTQVGTTLDNGTILSNAWTRQVGSGDPGSDITLTANHSGKAIMSLGVFSGVSASTPVDAFASVGDGGGTSHTSPVVAAANGDYVATWWTDKSTGVTAWTAPGSVTQRDDAYDTGSAGRFSMLFADSGGSVGPGSYGGLTATTNTSSDRAAMWTIALEPS
ncbi:MAG: PKD domain-containing protein [Nocardioides sp.]